MIGNIKDKKARLKKLMPFLIMGILLAAILIPLILAPTTAFSQSRSSDISIATLSNNTFVVGFINQSGAVPSAYFRIMNTSGQTIVNPVLVGASVTNNSRVYVEAMNNTAFIFAWTNSSNHLSYSVYNLNGVKLRGPTILNSETAEKLDISVVELGDRFVTCYNLGPNIRDFTYQINYNNGTQIIAETDLDTSIGDNLYLSNTVSCAKINNTRWIASFFDTGASDVFYYILDDLGTEIFSTQQFDANAGTHAELDVVGINDNQIAGVWYDSQVQTLEFSIMNSENVQILAPTTITNLGTDTRVSIAAVKQNKTMIEDWFVISWINQTSNQLRAATYNSSGSIMFGPYTLVENKDISLFDVQGKSNIVGNSIYPGTFIVGYVNSTNSSVAKTFYVNGSEWDGLIPSAGDTTKPNITILSPANNSIFPSTNVEINYSVADETNISSCWWTNNSGVYNHSIGCGTNITGQIWDEGSNIVRIYVNDTNNNINSSSVTFTFDTIKPVLTIQVPTNGSIYRTIDLNLNFTIIENLDLSWIGYSLNGALNVSVPINAVINITNDGIGTGFDRDNINSNVSQSFTPILF